MKLFASKTVSYNLVTTVGIKDKITNISTIIFQQIISFHPCCFFYLSETVANYNITASFDCQLAEISAVITEVWVHSGCNSALIMAHPSVGLSTRMGTLFRYSKSEQ
jgi:hypothetical protein